MSGRLLRDRLFDPYQPWLKYQACSGGVHATCGISKWPPKQNSKKNEKKSIKFMELIRLMKITQNAVFDMSTS